MLTTTYAVTINLSGLGGVAPADGTVDPTTVEQYRNNLLVTGSTFGSVSLGDVVMINNYPVTLVTGTTVANVATDINSLSAQNGAIAGTSGGNLTLQNVPLYTQIPVSVSDGTPGITAELGFVSPTKSAIALPTTLAQSEAKRRGNLRWNMIMARISQTMNINNVYDVDTVGAVLWGTDPTSISFNVVIDNDNPYAYDNNGNLVYGIPALETAVAQALMDSDILTVDLYDPTVTGPNPPGIPNGMSAVSLTVGSLTSSYSTALGAVSVTFVS
jgi:hypothetical protein